MRTAIAVVIALLSLAASLGSAGICMLAGLGWMLLFDAACCVVAALLLTRGLNG
jgi:hypothetical protein